MVVWLKGVVEGVDLFNSLLEGKEKRVCLLDTVVPFLDSLESTLNQSEQDMNRPSLQEREYSISMNVVS